MTTYESVVLAGGGARTFWQAGFWTTAAEPLGLRPRQIAAVSAGAAMSAAILSGRAELALRLFEEATRRNPKNAYWGNVFGAEPVFPHERMYRRTLLELIDAEALRKIHAGPDVRVLLGHPPRWLWPRAGMLLGLAAYTVDKRLRHRVHPELAQQLGFAPEVVSMRECPTPEALTDLILGSSCTPPMTPPLRWKGRSVLDGGVIDNVPVCALAGEPGNTLVLLSRRYPALPSWPGRTYVMPSARLSVSAWDYTDPAGLREAFDLGRRDGEAFAAKSTHAREAA